MHTAGNARVQAIGAKTCDDATVFKLTSELQDMERRIRDMEERLAWALISSIANAAQPEMSAQEQQVVNHALDQMRHGVTELDLHNEFISDAGMTRIAERFALETNVAIFG